MMKVNLNVVFEIWSDADTRTLLAPSERGIGIGSDLFEWTTISVIRMDINGIVMSFCLPHHLNRLVSDY
jgi:hypothetical protein